MINMTAKSFSHPVMGYYHMQNKTKKTEQTEERANNLYANADG